MTRISVGQGPSALPAMVFATPEAMGEHVAQMILPDIAAATAAGRRYLLGCPTGRTPIPVYQALGRLAAARDADLSGLVLAMMDEFLVAAGDGQSLAYAPADSRYSCRRAAWSEILGAINRDLRPPRRIPQAQVWFPDPAQPHRYDQQLQECGGVDLFLVASGASDGHVAFNPPDSASDSISRIVTLAETTRQDNRHSFAAADLTPSDDVPRHGVTVGLGTIRSLSRRVVLPIHGANKREAVKRLNACHGFDPRWPASLIFLCQNPQILLDEESLS